jgi:hypothetical protein
LHLVPPSSKFFKFNNIDTSSLSSSTTPAATLSSPDASKNKKKKKKKAGDTQETEEPSTAESVSTTSQCNQGVILVRAQFSKIPTTESSASTSTSTSANLPPLRFSCHLTPKDQASFSRQIGSFSLVHIGSLMVQDKITNVSLPVSPSQLSNTQIQKAKQKERSRLRKAAKTSTSDSTSSTCQDSSSSSSATLSTSLSPAQISSILTSRNSDRTRFYRNPSTYRSTFETSLNTRKRKHCDMEEETVKKSTSSLDDSMIESEMRSPHTTKKARRQLRHQPNPNKSKEKSHPIKGHSSKKNESSSTAQSSSQSQSQSQSQNKSKKKK